MSVPACSVEMYKATCQRACTVCFIERTHSLHNKSKEMPQSWTQTNTHTECKRHFHMKRCRQRPGTVNKNTISQSDSSILFSAHSTACNYFKHSRRSVCVCVMCVQPHPEALHTLTHTLHKCTQSPAKLPAARTPIHSHSSALHPPIAPFVQNGPLEWDTCSVSMPFPSPPKAMLSHAQCFITHTRKKVGEWGETTAKERTGTTKARNKKPAYIICCALTLLLGYLHWSQISLKGRDSGN